MHEHETAERTGPTRRVAPAQNADSSTVDAVGRMLSLQRAVGNTAVARMIQEERQAQEAPVQRSSVHDVLRTSGRPLDSGVRQEMEARLGGNFSGVRVHDDSAALASAAEIGARSYTSGQHIVLGNQTDLPHELVHTQQQAAGPVPGTDNGTGLSVSDPSDHAEQEAVRVSERAMASPAPEVQRAPAHDHHPGHRTDEPAVQRIIAGTDAGGTQYDVSEGGLFAVVDGARSIWAQPGAAVSPALAPTGQTVVLTVQGATITYHEHQIARWLLKDCLHTAEEIINNAPGGLQSARELDWGDAKPSAGKYSRVRVGNRWRKFGKSTEGNRKDARDYTGPRDAAANPGIGQAFALVALTDSPDPEKEIWPYHAGAVVAVDGNDRVTLEEIDQRGVSSRGSAHMYTVGGAGSFHSAWADNFSGQEVTTIVLDMAKPEDLVRRAQAFEANAFTNEDDRDLGWPPSPAESSEEEQDDTVMTT